MDEDGPGGTPLARTSIQTNTRFLEGLKDPSNAPVWEEFDSRYRPILVAVGRRLGLSETDAADAAQDAILRFIREFREGKYERSRGRLRAWMTMMAKSCIAEQWRSRARARIARGESAMADVESGGELDRVWDQEVRRAASSRPARSP
jgi:DNA-directed RNA polymerase specialized sigma24 family protein